MNATHRPVSEKSPIAAAKRHESVSSLTEIAAARRDLLISILNNAVESSPVDLVIAISQLPGARLAHENGKDVDDGLDLCINDLDESHNAICKTIDCAGFDARLFDGVRGLLNEAKSLPEYAAVVRSTGTWTQDLSARQELEEHLGDILDAYLRVYELRCELVGPDDGKWGEVAAPALPDHPKLSPADQPSARVRKLESDRSRMLLPARVIDCACDSSPANLQMALRHMLEADLFTDPRHADRAARIANKIESTLDRLIEPFLDRDFRDRPFASFVTSVRQAIVEKGAQAGHAAHGLELIEEAYRQAAILAHDLRKDVCAALREEPPPECAIR